MTTQAITPQASAHAFDIRTATAVIAIYEGASDGLQAFVDACNLMKELTADEHQAMLLKFMKTRITGKARLGLPENIKTFDDFIKNITERCHDTTSPEQILAKLKSIRQRESLDSYCEQIEIISNKLKNVYIEKQIPEDVANNMVKKAVVDALVNGVNNQETKLILKAGSFKTVKEAIQKVQENGNSQNQSILSFSSNRPGHGGNKPFPFQGQTSNRFNNRPNQQNSYNRSQHQQNFYRGNNRPRFQGRGGRYQNNNRQFHYRPNFNRGGGNRNHVYAVNSMPMPPALMNHSAAALQSQPIPLGNATPQSAAPRMQQQQNDYFLGQVYGSQGHPNLPQY